MLDEYFSFLINDEGELESIPLLLPGYNPSLNKLPLCEIYPRSIVLPYPPDCRT